MRFLGCQVRDVKCQEVVLLWLRYHRVWWEMNFQTDWRMEFGGDGLRMIERMSR